MGSYQKEFWISTGAGQSRKQRASGVYYSYIPTKLAERDLALDADVVGDVAAAQSAIALLNNSATTLTNTEGLARLLMRAEAVSSSYIEGLNVGARRLLRAEAALAQSGDIKTDSAAISIVGNIHAMEDALKSALDERQISSATILSIHKALCANTPIERFGGKVRTVQNWVGGSSYNPLNAEYVPPAPEYVTSLLEDLAQFCNKEDISPVEQAAVAHAQFETIHPFIDGNGRTGRALIHLILRRRGVASQFVPPVSLALATHAKDYIAGLVGFRFDGKQDAGKQDADKAQQGLNDWVSTFAGCCILACKEAHHFENALEEIKQKWVQQAGPFRQGSIAYDVIDEICAMPIFTISLLAEQCNRSVAAVNTLVTRLEEHGCIKSMKQGKRNRVFEAPDVINEFSVLERKLATPAEGVMA